MIVISIPDENHYRHLAGVRPSGLDHAPPWSHAVLALPTAQRAFDFADVDRQWVVTTYSLAFGSLPPRRPASGSVQDNRPFIVGLVGIAVSSAVAGTSGCFGILVAGRTTQGVFGALLASGGTVGR
ncbi:hypothetical protein ACGFLS_02085 [Streptomyces abikoensis]|uniref:hypothetical protein n=1 Tax=Streptomyces abikoensis TaxID=97398 RepID=UPI00371E826A